MVALPREYLSEPPCEVERQPVLAEAPGQLDHEPFRVADSKPLEDGSRQESHAGGAACCRISCCPGFTLVRLVRAQACADRVHQHLPQARCRRRGGLP